MLNERVSAAKKIAADLHQAEDAIDEAMIRIAQLAATLPTARRDTNMSAIVGQAAMSALRCRKPRTCRSMSPAGFRFRRARRGRDQRYCADP